MSRFACIVTAVGISLATGIAEGAAELRFSVAGLASNMPVDSYFFGFRDYYHASGGGGGAGKANLTDVEVTRPVDGFSPSIMNAVVSGTSYSSATLTACKPNCLSPTYSVTSVM